MDPAAFATYQPPQGSGGLFRPSSSPYNGGGGGSEGRRPPHMRTIQNSSGSMMSSNGGSIPQVISRKKFKIKLKFLTEKPRLITDGK